MARYIYLNVNPDQQKVSDCVTRAIHFTTGIPYSQVRKDLYYTGKLFKCEKLCMCCYRHYIEQILGCKPVNCDGMTLEEFADKNKKGTYLVRMNGHISSVDNGDCYDIWDCRQEPLTDAWKV